MGGLHSLALGDWDGVLHRGAVHLGHGVAMLHLHRDELDLGVVNTVLGGDLPAGVLHCGCHRVGHSVGWISQELSISLGLGLSLPLTVGSVGGGGCGVVALDLLLTIIMIVLPSQITSTTSLQTFSYSISSVSTTWVSQMFSALGVQAWVTRISLLVTQLGAGTVRGAWWNPN